MVFVIWIIAGILLVMEAGLSRPQGARSPYRAAAASLFLPGLGQLYNGETRKALLVWAVGVFFVLLAALLGLLHHFFGLVLVLIVAFAVWVSATVQSSLRAKSLQNYTPRAINRWYVYVGAILIVDLIALPVRSSLGMRAFKIPTEAMQPTLEVGDYIMTRLETSDSYVDNRGDVLVFKYPGDNKTDYIKRVVAFPGETIEIRDNVILINGEPIPDPWARPLEQSINSRVQNFGPYVVPEEAFFVLGDNIPNSADSRIWGAVPRGNIVGVAEFIYFSWDSPRNRVRLDRIGKDIKTGG